MNQSVVIGQSVKKKPFSCDFAESSSELCGSEASLESSPLSICSAASSSASARWTEADHRGEMRGRFNKSISIFEKHEV